MEDSIRAIVQQTDAVVGVAILDLTDQRAFYLNADAVYPPRARSRSPCSASSIASTSALLAARARSSATSTPSTRRTASVPRAFCSDDGRRLPHHESRPGALVVSLSDNSATNVLIDRVGMDNVNAWLARLGLKETRLRRHMMDVKAAQEGRENTATPREFVMMLSALHEGRVFGKATTEDFFKMLSTQKSSYIPRLLPADLMIANKPGNLDAVRNDAGIVFVPGRPFAIAVMTTFARDELDAEQSIARIAHAAWSYFDRVGKSSPLGRVVR